MRLRSNMDAVDRFVIEVRGKHRGQTLRSRTRKRSVCMPTRREYLDIGGVGRGSGWGGGVDGGKGGGEVLRRNMFEEHNYKI